MKHTVTFTPCGHGQWTASTEYHGQKLTMHWTDAEAVDLIKSERHGYKKVTQSIRKQIIQKYK